MQYFIINPKVKNLQFFVVLMVFFFSSNILIGQEQFTKDSVYEKSEEYLIVSKVIDLDSNSSVEILKNKFKNWAGVNFRSYKDVLVSETEDQIILNFILSYNYDGNLGMVLENSHYYRFIVQFKKGKIRIKLYDDGNTVSYNPPIAAHTYYMDKYFGWYEVLNNKGLKKVYYRDIKELIATNKKFVINFETAMRKVEEPDKKDNW